MTLTQDATIVRPESGFNRLESMTTNACVEFCCLFWFWECTGFGTLLKPKPGDCCVS